MPFLFENNRGIYSLLHSPCPPLSSHLFLVLKSLAHFIPQNIRAMLTDDAKKKRRQEENDTYVHPGIGISCSQEWSQIGTLIYLIYLCRLRSEKTWWYHMH